MLELFARHGGFDLTVDARGDLDVDQHHTVEDLGIALGEAVSKALGARQGDQPRRLFRDADGRNTGGRGDRSRRPAARGRRSAGQGAARRRSADRAGARLLRGVRDRCAGQRARQGALRPLEPSQDRSGVQGVRARDCASRSPRIGGSRRCCRAPRGCCDRAHRLQGRQPDVGEEGAGDDRRRGVRAATRRRISRRLPASSCPASAISARPARSISGWIDAILARVGEGRPLFGICLGMQWLFEGSEEAPELPGLGLLSGRCYRLGGYGAPLHQARAQPAIKVPHVGWNSLAVQREGGLLDQVDDRLAGLFHAQLRRAGDRRHARRHRARRAVRRGRAARPHRRRAVPPGEIRRRRAAASCAISWSSPDDDAEPAELTESNRHRDTETQRSYPRITRITRIPSGNRASHAAAARRRGRVSSVSLCLCGTSSRRARGWPCSLSGSSPASTCATDRSSRG